MIPKWPVNQIIFKVEGLLTSWIDISMDEELMARVDESFKGDFKEKTYCNISILQSITLNE